MHNNDNLKGKKVLELMKQQKYPFKDKNIYKEILLRNQGQDYVYIMCKF